VDPDLDPQDPYDFGFPEAGSVSQPDPDLSIYHQAKIVSKALIPTVL
jgi:hypothetical protein